MMNLQGSKERWNSLNRASVLSPKHELFCCDQNGPPARRSEPDWRMEGAYLKRYVTDEQRSRRPIFIATLWAGASWLVFRVARSTRMTQRWALLRQSGSDRLEKQPTDLRQNTSYFGDRTLGSIPTRCIRRRGQLASFLRRLFEQSRERACEGRFGINFSEGEDGIATAILSSMAFLPSRMERRLGPESDKRTDGGRVPRALPRQRPGIGSRYGHRGGSGR